MSPLRSRLGRIALAVLGASLLLALAGPGLSEAKANVLCKTAGAPLEAVSGGLNAITGGAIGAGNPLGDACDALSGEALGTIAEPIAGALGDAGSAILEQIASWVADGASWLIGRVVALSEQTTSPQLSGAGFLRQYRKMAEIAVFMAAAMLLLAVLEGLAQGNAAMLARAAFVNLPLAFLATSVAYALVQLLLGATDGLSHAIAASAGPDGRRFFAAAVKSLGSVGSAAGEAIGHSGGPDPLGGAAGHLGGSVGVPLFVTFLAAAIGAFAAFFVWIELLMRDAAVYAVALFMPLSLAASIWPRWSGAMRRGAELLIVVIASKFVIVAIISLAAAMAAEAGGEVEQLLAAAALLLLACFSPFLLLRLVPFAEGAMAAAYGRHSASGGALTTTHLITQVQMMRNMSRSNWSHAAGSGGGRPGGGNDATGQPGAPPRGGGPRGGGRPSGGGSGSPGGAEKSIGGVGGVAGVAAAAPAAAAALPLAAAKGARASAQRLSEGAAGQVDAQAQSRPAQQASAPRPGPQRAGAPSADPPPERSDEPTPREAKGGPVQEAAGRPPRPASEPSPARGGRGSTGG